MGSEPEKGGLGMGNSVYTSGKLDRGGLRPGIRGGQIENVQLFRLIRFRNVAVWRQHGKSLPRTANCIPRNPNGRHVKFRDGKLIQFLSSKGADSRLQSDSHAG